MSKIEELIQQYCPDGVEYVKLGDVCEFRNGFAFKSNLFQSNGLPIVRITNITGQGVDMEDVKYFHMDDYPKTKMSAYAINDGDVLVAMSGATTGKIATYREKQTAYLNQRTGKFVPCPLLNNRFLFHFLLTQVNQMYVMAGGGAQPNLSSNDLKTKIEIPLPPLPVQEEIVRILDTFTELQAELQKELEARKEQFEYYQDLLLNKSQFSNHFSIGNLCLVKKGKTPIQKAKEGNYPLVVTAMERKSCEEYQFDANAVCIPLISSRGHGVASLNHVYYQEGKFALGNILCAVIPLDESSLKAKFLYYYIEYAKDFILVPLMKGGANVSMHCSDIEKVKIPLPSIQKQIQIISVLDKFETLIIEMTAEIEARKQQYEYYRDKLLTFKKKEA